MINVKNTSSYASLESQNSRRVLLPKLMEIAGVESDENVRSIKFKFPKIVDGVDLTEMQLKINFMNGRQEKGQYLVTDLVPYPSDENYVTFSWKFSRLVTRCRGITKFIVCAVKTDDDGKIVTEWNTSLSQIRVFEGLEVEEPEISPEEKDVIAQLISLSQNSADNAALSAHQAQEEAEKVLNYGPKIGENGNWYLKGEDTGHPSRGEKGDKGDPGEPGESGVIPDGTITVEKLRGTEREYPGGLNQIDYDNCISGYTINAETGELVENSLYSVSNKMPVEANTNYYARINDWDAGTYIIFYDVSDVFVSSVKIGQTSLGVYGEIPSNANYSKACFRGIGKKPCIVFADKEVDSGSFNGNLLYRYVNAPWGEIKTSELQTYFKNSTVPIQSLKGSGAKMYNMFSHIIDTEAGVYSLPICQKYYIYNMSDETITNATYKLIALMKNKKEKALAQSFIYIGGYTEAFINEADIKNVVAVYIDLGTLTENQIAGLMISERSDLKEYHAYGTYYYEPDNDVKEFVSAAQSDKVKQYDGGVMLTIGDSYTAYMKNNFEAFAGKHGLVQDNRGLASSTIAGDTSGSIGYKPFWDRIDAAVSEYSTGFTINDKVYNSDDVKLITFMGGANDWSTVNDSIDRLGKGVNTTDKGTLYGSLNHCFETLLKNFPNADIVCILQPCNYANTVPQSEEDAKNVGFESLEQAKEMTDEQYSVYLMQRKERIVRTMAEQYGIPTVDCCFKWFNPCNPNDAVKYWRKDKLHCTAEGHEAIIAALEKKVNALPFTRN